MACRIEQLTIDAHHAHAQSLFWAEALGLSEDPEDPNLPDHDECLIRSADGSTRLLFINVPDDKVIKNRLHLDVRPTDRSREDEVARLMSMGATEVADLRRPDGLGWIVLADPEGNEFCVLRRPS